MSQLFPEKNLEAMLRICQVPVRPASKEFRKWLKDTYPYFLFVEEFCLALPSKLFRVEKSEFWLCYLGSEKEITSLKNEYHFDLIPIGSLMDGSFLVIDSLDKTRMNVGRVHQHRAMAGDCLRLDRQSYSSFSMSYVDWLHQLWEYPENNRYA